MINWIVSSSIRLRLVVTTIAALLLIFGFVQLHEIPVDALPEFSRPYVEIQTEALGLSAQEVEAMITTPMEADMLNGTTWVEEIRSVSLPGLSSITLIFEQGTDIMRARQVVQERLTEVFALPNVSKPPTMINPISSAGRFMEIGLSSQQLSLIEMSVLARWTIAPKLMGLPGVANVSIWGERERQLQVQIDPNQLRDEGLTLMQIIKTTGNSLWASPLSFLEASTPGTGGWIDTPNQRLGVRHILPIKTAEDLARIPIEGHSDKRLGDIAMVLEDHQPLIGDAIINDTPSLMLVVEKFPWANTTEVTQDVEEALDALKPALADLEMDPTLFRPATFIERAVMNISLAMLIGFVLLIAGLFLFLRRWRIVLITASSIVLSVIVAGTILYIGGVTLNLLSIAGLVIALGVIINNAVLDTNNMMHQMQYKNDHTPRSIAANIYKSMVGTRKTLFYATLMMLLVVLPLLFLEGISGAFYSPAARTFILALLVSTLVAVTLTPALSYLMLKSGSETKDSAQTQKSRPGADKMTGWIFARSGWVFAGVCILLFAGIVMSPMLRQESLIPPLKETDLVVQLKGCSCASHPAMSRIITRASLALRKIPGVQNVSAHVGRAIMSDKRTNINTGELWISIDPSADYEKTVAEIKDVAQSYPGLSPEVLTYLQAKIRDELSGTDESLVVRVYGENMDIIRSKADDVRKMLSGIDGITGAYVEYPEEMPTVEIQVDIERAKLYHLKPGDVRRAATALVSGIVVGSLFEEQKVFDVVVWGTPDTRSSISSIKGLLIDTPLGGYVRLDQVADVRVVPSVMEIHRDAVARRIDVIADIKGRDHVAVAADIENGLKTIDFPLEYRAELRGEYAARLDTQKRLTAFAIAAALGIFLLMQAFFRSWRLAVIVFLTLPVSLVGGVIAALLINGGLLSLGSVIGFIAVLGIATHNAIALIGRYRQLESNNGDTFKQDLVQKATAEQIPAMTMSAIFTALVFLPLIFFGNATGLELLHPLAVVVVGGLVTSSLFSIAGVPAIYSLFGTVREPDISKILKEISTTSSLDEILNVGEPAADLQEKGAFGK